MKTINSNQKLFTVECFTGEKWIKLFTGQTYKRAEKIANFMKLAATKQMDVKISLEDESTN